MQVETKYQLLLAIVNLKCRQVFCRGKQDGNPFLRIKSKKLTLQKKNILHDADQF